MYIVAVMITAVIFSVTGLGVLNMALLVNLETQTAVLAMEDQIDAESSVNIALWRLNSGDDTLGTYTDGDLSSVYDSTDMTLSITNISDGDTTGFFLQLEEDYHFQRAMASMNSINTNNKTVGEEAEHRPRENFEFLPEIDEAYWLAVADSVYADNSRLFQDVDLVEGILVFTGTDNKFQDINVENTTMVFMGDGTVDFRRDNTIKAAFNDSTVFPALVFTDSSSYFYIGEIFSTRKDHIEGAIFSMGTIILHKGELSGPVVGRDIHIWANMDFLDDEFSEYYAWPKGFGSFKSYDWPKQITLWEEY